MRHTRSLLFSFFPSYRIVSECPPEDDDNDNDVASRTKGHRIPFWFGREMPLSAKAQLSHNNNNNNKKKKMKKRTKTKENRADEEEGEKADAFFTQHSAAAAVPRNFLLPAATPPLPGKEQKSCPTFDENFHSKKSRKRGNNDMTNDKWTVDVLLLLLF